MRSCFSPPIILSGFVFSQGLLDFATHYFSRRSFRCGATRQKAISGRLSCPVLFDGAIRTDICKRYKYNNKIRKKLTELPYEHKAKNLKYIRKLRAGAGNTLKLLRWSGAEAGAQGPVLSSRRDQAESRLRNHIPAWLLPAPTAC